MVPVEELHLAPLASEDGCGRSFDGMRSRAPVPASVMIFQPTFSCRRFAVSASTPRSCGLSTPVCLPPLAFWNSLMAATMRSLTSPDMAPLYSPTHARSDWIAWRSACAMALAVSAGLFKAGRIGTVATPLGFAPLGDGALICPWGGAPEVTKINVAVSTDLMTSLKSLNSAQFKHICLVGHNSRGSANGGKTAVIARSEATKQSKSHSAMLLTGLLPGTCHRAAPSDEPLARNDGQKGHDGI